MAPEVVDDPELVLVDAPLDDPVDEAREEVVTPEIVEVEAAEDEPVIEVVELVPITGPEDEAVNRDEVVVL